jgi:putative ABC transport system permease protein
MKFLPLVWRNLMRRKIRTIVTVMTITVAFLLFGVLMAIRAAFSMGVDIAGADRLMVIHRVSIIQPLPRSYGAKIRATPGVTDLTHANWFGGYYQEPTNFIANMAVDPESWLRLYPEFQLPEEQKQAWFKNRGGAIVGIDTARKFNWKIGDHVPLISPIYRKPDGGPWDFTIEGIYDSTQVGVDKARRQSYS